jgi:hypothetical protein
MRNGTNYYENMGIRVITTHFTTTEAMGVYIDPESWGRVEDTQKC